MFREALTALPDEAADWSPVSGGNTAVVLVTHSITSTRFWIGNGSGQQGSMARYRAEERAPSFEARGLTIAVLAARIDAFAAEAEQILASGDAASLEAIIDWRAEDPAEPLRTGVEALLRAVAHLREHVGHMQLMRDLWLARE